MVFDFITLKNQEINKNVNGIEINATLTKKSSLVYFKGILKGDIDLTCDRCLNKNKVFKTIACDFKISNIVYNSDNAEEVMYEFVDNKIDIDFIIESEINVLKSDYFICDKCNDKEFEFKGSLS